MRWQGGRLGSGESTEPARLQSYAAGPNEWCSEEPYIAYPYAEAFAFRSMNYPFDNAVNLPGEHLKQAFTALLKAL